MPSAVPTLGTHEEVGQGAEGIRGSQQQYKPTSLCQESGSPISSHPLEPSVLLILFDMQQRS